MVIIFFSIGIWVKIYKIISGNMNIYELVYLIVF